jgi:hypothetical protein
MNTGADGKRKDWVGRFVTQCGGLGGLALGWRVTAPLARMKVRCGVVGSKNGPPDTAFPSFLLSAVLLAFGTGRNRIGPGVCMAPITSSREIAHQKAEAKFLSSTEGPTRTA